MDGADRSDSDDGFEVIQEDDYDFEMKKLIEVFGDLTITDPNEDVADEGVVLPANMQMSEIDEKAPSKDNHSKKLKTNKTHQK